MEKERSSLGASSQRPVIVPPLGQTVDTLTLVTWYKQEGDAVEQGEPLFAVETDKAILDVEAPATGVLRGVTASPGDQVKVLATIAEIVGAPVARRNEEGKRKKEDRGGGPDVTPPVAAPPDAASPVAARPDVAPPQPASAQPAPHRVFISPRARRLAESQNVPLDRVKPTGPSGAIIERDVMVYLASPALHSPAAAQPPAAEAETRSLRLSGELATQVDATGLVGLRSELAMDGVPVTYTDLFLAILAKALGEHPQLKVSPRIDLGVAVDTDHGLLVPVMRAVDRKGLAQLAAETAALTERARGSQCTAEELSGSAFTLINLGIYGIDAFTPIINLAEATTNQLVVGRIVTQPAWIVDHVEPRQFAWLSLTFDHRLVDAGRAARFLQRVAQLAEKPHLLIA